MSRTLELMTAFTLGTVITFIFFYPGITTCLTGLLDKNDAIAQLQEMIRDKP